MQQTSCSGNSASWNFVRWAFHFLRDIRITRKAVYRCGYRGCASEVLLSGQVKSQVIHIEVALRAYPALGSPLRLPRDTFMLSERIKRKVRPASCTATLSIWYRIMNGTMIFTFLAPHIVAGRARSSQLAARRLIASVTGIHLAEQ